MKLAQAVLLILGCLLTITGVVLQVRGAYVLEKDPDDEGTFKHGGSKKMTMWSVVLIGAGALAGLLAGLLALADE